MDDFERLFEHYRVVGPPDDLRDRILSGAASRSSKGLAAWLVSAGAVAAAAVFSVLAGRVGDEIARRAGEADHGRAAAVHELAEALGGDESARQEAERVVPRTLRLPLFVVGAGSDDEEGGRRD